MERTNNLYIVIQFLEFPYKDIDEYVCVPSSWIIHRRKTDKKVVVSYPHNENPSDTAKRVKKRENFSKDWNLFMDFVTQGTDSYDDAKNVIKERKKKKEKMDNVHYKYRSLHKKKRDQESMVEKKTRRPKQNAKLNREIDKPLDLVVTSKNDHKSATKRPERTALPNPPTDAALKRSKAVEPAESISEVVEQPCETFECSNENQSSPTHENFSIQNSCTSEIPVEKSDDRSSLKETEHVENSTQTNLTFDPSKIIVNTAFFEDFLSVLRGAHTTSVNTHSLINMLIKKLIDNTETLREVKNFVIGIRSSISDIPTASSSTNTGAEIEKISKKDKNKRKQQDVEYDDDDDDDDEEIPKKKRCHKRKFVLPPEYDKNDSKWTLKYREYAPGLVELMPYTSVYVNSVKLRNCKRLSKDCKSLARMLLVEIFTQNALSICSLTGSRARAYDVEGAVIRPGLDENARTVLLTFVEEYGREKGWITLDTQSIQNSLRNKMQEMRSKYG